MHQTNRKASAERDRLHIWWPQNLWLGALEGTSLKGAEVPHVAVAMEMLEGETQPSDHRSLHPAYGRVLHERVWERAILSTLPEERLRENR